MNKFLFFCFIIVVGFVAGDVQKETITLNWANGGAPAVQTWDEAVFSFEGASFPDANSLVPVFCRIYDTQSGTRDFKFALENLVFSEVQVPQGFDAFNTLGSEISVTSKKLKSGKTQKLQLQIVPFKRLGDKVFKIESFLLTKLPVKNNTLKSTPAKLASHEWKSVSVLKDGAWKKISTSGKGIYKIPYSKLSEWGFSNPAQVKVFGSGGKILSEDPGETGYDDLAQNAVWHGKSGGADCLFFYAPGSTEWTYDSNKKLFEHHINDYATKGFFFLTENVGNNKTPQKIATVEQNATHTVSDYDAFGVHEMDLENVLKLGSGKQWYGEKFRDNLAKNFDFELENLQLDATVSVKVSAIGRSFNGSEMSVSINQAEAGKLEFYQVNTGSQTSKYADPKIGTFAATLSSEAAKISLKYFTDKASNNPDDNATAWLDWIEVNYKRQLILGKQPLFFRDAGSVGSQNIVAFNLKNTTAGTQVMDVTDINNVKEISVEVAGTTATAKIEAAKLREFVAFNPDAIFKEPELVGEVGNQNLHGLSTPEFLIVTHANFMDAANRLADFHRTYDNMDVEVAEAGQVYNEFSSGAKNATGIRNFIKMFYDRDNGLKYVLLFGDGSYDNRGIKSGTKNFVPTYQSENSLNPVASFVTDDYFAILDAGESVYDGAVDLGIGRIPASTPSEANLVVDKIESYYRPEALGEWRGTVCFIGDDEDGGLHMGDSEKLANSVNENHKAFITDKIYFDAYPEEVTPAGERYPDVTDAINERVKNGVLVLNYVGHANDRYMADEHVLDISNVNAWSNANNLPIFVTATCEFSRFDTDETSIGEYILFNASGGGIGLFSTTRVVFAYSNFLLSRSFYNFVFETDENGERYRMGDIMRLAKINTINTTNKRNFSLLADPALKLSYPKYRVITTSVNGKDPETATDTMAALQKIEVDGYVSDYFGGKLGDFSGEVAITVYDKAVTLATLGNGGERPFNFKVQENIIYKGKAKVQNGDFNFSFVLPKDISYGTGTGKIVYYAKNGEADAHGAYNNFVIGGASGQSVSDKNGPEIELFIDNEDFLNGGKTSKNPLLIARLNDENGINTAGTGIGHDITAVLDNDYSNVMVLNNYYESEINDFTSGTLQFLLQDISPGTHTLRLKAWDVANNSSEAEIEFEVSGEFFISSVESAPNPATDYTNFSFAHNQAGASLNVVVEIFDLMGRRVDYINTQVGSNGTNSNPLRWDFNDTKTQFGSGIYVYKVTAQNAEGLVTSKSGKLMVAR